MRSGALLDLANALALLLALLLAMLGGGLAGPAGGPARSGQQRALPAHTWAARIERAPDGTRALRDARGVLVPLRDYRRIASSTLSADRVLADLSEPSRIVAFSRYAAATSSGQRYADKPTLGARDGVEPVLALKPDLLLVNDLVDENFVARLREQGIQVFDLGPMHGLSTLLPAIEALGLLIGAPERAASYGRTLERRLARVSRDGRERASPSALSEAPRPAPGALYLSIYGDKLFAAGADTSYHDVVTYAGLSDVAARAGLHGWPELTGERVLALDPEVLITRTGMGALLCRHPGLQRSRPCRGAGRMVELDGALLDDPGPGMLEAAEALYDTYWLR